MLAPAGLSLANQSLGFGQMQMIQGRAFLLGRNAADAGALVSKQWVQMDGRQFLIEEVPVKAIVNGLAKLPLTASASTPNSHLPSANARLMASKHLALPPQRVVKNTAQAMLLAKAKMPAQGFVLDYYLTISNSVASYTFQGDTTYYVSGEYAVSNLTFEGGTVIKMGWGGQLDTYNPVTCNTGPYRPAIFTSVNDDSVGEIISGISSGTPGDDDVNTFLSMTVLNGGTLHDLRFSYCSCGVNQDNADLWSWITIINCQFVRVDFGLRVGQVTLENVLMTSSGDKDFAVLFCGSGGAALTAENVTADGFSCFAASTGDPGWWGVDDAPVATLANCIVTCGDMVSWSPYGGMLVTNATFLLPAPTSPVYQSAGGGNYYLADNTYRNAGTANIDPALLADLQQKTTWPPMVYSNTTISDNLPLTPQVPRDVDQPDLGYHYDPLDYALGDVIVTNATVGVSPGTVVGIFGVDNGYYSYGLSIGANAQLLCYGTAASMNHIVTYNTVQESSCEGWQVPTIASLTDYLGGAGGMFDVRFTDWSLIGLPNVLHLLVAQSYPANLRDCQFHSGGIWTYFGPTINSTNCLFDRVYLTLYPEDYDATVLANNTFYGGGLEMLPFGSWHAVVKDNFFDQTFIVDHSSSYTYTGGYNAYRYGQSRMQPTCTNDLVFSLGYVPYQAGPLGSYYQVTNSPLINRGSQTAAAADLANYTVLTNQAPDTGTVDIGFHYATISAPVAYDFSAPPTCQNTAADIYGIASDANGLSSLTYPVVTAPAHGAVSYGTSPAEFIYTPNHNFTGTDSFTYVVYDGFLDSAPATVYITVGDEYLYPNPQNVMTGTNQSVNIGLTASSGCTNAFTYTIVAGPTNGTLSGTGTNRTYTPHTNYEGLDTFIFTASDGVWTSTSPATVTIYVVAGPTNLTAQCASNGPGIVLNWGLDGKVQEMEADDALAIDGFEIYRRTSPGVFTTNDIIYTTPDASQTDYLDVLVVPGTTNYYKVDFFNYVFDSDYNQITNRSPFSNEATNIACLPPSLGTNGVDVAFIIDNTGSMGDSISAIQDAIDYTLDYIIDAAGGNYRLALVTPDLDNDGGTRTAYGSYHDMVDVRVSFALTNRINFKNAVNALSVAGGNNPPESTDQCLNTVVNALLAAGRINDDVCTPASPLLQTNNFSPAFRTNAVKLVVLITDAPPSGFCDSGAYPYDTSYTNNPHTYALEASTNHIKINAILINDGDEGSDDDDARPVMQDYAATSCGWYSEAAITYDPTLSDQNLEAAILKIIYTADACH